MALQGPFYQQVNDINTPSMFHPKAYFKVIKASIVAEDYEVLRPTEEEINVVEFVTSHKGQGVVMVYADEVAYKNRAIPVGSFFVDFPATTGDLGRSLLNAAYKAIPATLSASAEEYIQV